MGQDGFDIIANFGFSSGRDRNKFEKITYSLVDGIPALKEQALSGMLCSIQNQVDVGTHWLFVCSVEDGFTNTFKKDILPMSYSDFRAIKSGKQVTNKETSTPETKNNGDKYICKICGYIHDPAVEGIEFKDLPDSYTCPVCGAPKSDFELLK